jgi:hypothetical protein
MEVQRHWNDEFWEGSRGSMKRKPGDRPSCTTTRGGNYVFFGP